MSNELPPAAQVLHDCGVPFELRAYDPATKDRPGGLYPADLPVGEHGSVIKSILLSTSAGPACAVVQYSHQVDMKRVMLALDIPKKPSLMPTDDVFDVTGYRVGAVPPIGLPGHIIILIDDSLLKFAQLRINAGAPGQQITVKTAELLRLTRARVNAIRKGQ